jgi:oxygen-dependent protoporphyrinogen oxidase
MTAPHVAVVGAGVSGLAAAHRLRGLLGPATVITVLDKSTRVGGVLHTVDLAGVPYDVGAEAFLLGRPEVPALLDELGLADQVVQATTATPTVRAGGRTVPLPGATLLGIPTSRADLTEVLTPAGAARAARERELRLHWDGRDVALGPLVRERFGDELAQRLVDPLLGGVYAGRVDSLGLRATMPLLAAALDAGASSLTAAADVALPEPLAAPGAARRPVFGALRGGYRVLLDALVEVSGAKLMLGTTVRGLHRRDGGWRLELGSAPIPEYLDADAVVLAVPAATLRRLLAAAVPAASAAVAGVELASSAVIGLALRAEDAAALPTTSGVLVATGEPLAAKAVTYSARKWPHLAAESSGGFVRLRASVGRYGEADALQVDDGELVARVLADVAALTGITAGPVATCVQRWGGGLPQYGVGHLDRVAELQRAVAAEPRLAVAGSVLDGVGVPACIGAARAAAERIVEQVRELRAAPPAPTGGSMGTWHESTTRS